MQAVTRACDAAGNVIGERTSKWAISRCVVNLLPERIAPNTRTFGPVFEQRLED